MASQHRSAFPLFLQLTHSPLQTVVCDQGTKHLTFPPPPPPHQSPGHLVSLYNSVISHLASVASSVSLSSISWPLPEFAPRQFGSPLDPHLPNNEGFYCIKFIV